MSLKRGTRNGRSVWDRSEGWGREGRVVEGRRGEGTGGEGEGGWRYNFFRMVSVCERGGG